MNSNYLMNPVELPIGDQERNSLLQAILEGGNGRSVEEVFEEKMAEATCWDDDFSGTRSALEDVYKSPTPSLAVAMSRLDRARLYLSDESRLCCYMALRPVGAVAQESIATMLSRLKVKTMPEIKRWISSMVGSKVDVRSNLTFDHYDELLSEHVDWSMIDFFSKTPFPAVIQRCAVVFGLEKTKTLESVESCFGTDQRNFRKHLNHSISGISLDVAVGRDDEFVVFSRAWLVMISSIAQKRKAMIAAREPLSTEQEELYFLMLLAIRVMLPDGNDELVLIEALDLDPGNEYYQGALGVYPVRTPYYLHDSVVHSSTIRSAVSMLQTFDFGCDQVFRFHLQIMDQLLHECLSARNNGKSDYDFMLGAPINQCLPGCIGLLGWGLGMRVFQAVSFEMMYVESRLLPQAVLRIDDALAREGEERFQLLDALEPVERQWAMFRLRVVDLINALMRSCPRAVYEQFDAIFEVTSCLGGLGKNTVFAYQHGAGRYDQLMSEWKEAVANERFDEVAALSAELSQLKSSGTNDWLLEFNQVLDKIDIDALRKGMEDEDRFSLPKLQPAVEVDPVQIEMLEAESVAEGVEQSVVDDLKRQLKRSRSEVHSLKAQLNTHEHQLVTRTKVDAVTLGLMTESRVSLVSVFEFIKQAYPFVDVADNFDELISDCHYESPRKLLGVLVALCQDYVPAISNGEPDSTARRSIDRYYAANESESTMASQLSELRDFRFAGKTHRMEQHLTIGVARCPQKCVQVYFKIVEGRLLLGYVGRHLPVSGS